MAAYWTPRIYAQREPNRCKMAVCSSLSKEGMCEEYLFWDDCVERPIRLSAMVTMKNRLQFPSNCSLDSFLCLVHSSWGEFPHGSIVQCCILDISTRGQYTIADVSCRTSRLRGTVTDDTIPGVGEKAPAYVVRTNPKGCFLRISRQVEARVILKELSVGFVADPATTFPPGRLVLGKVKKVITSSKGITGATRLDMDLRETSVMGGTDTENKISFQDIQVGQKYMGTITRIEEYGAFVRLENSVVSGLVHKSECSENFIVNVSSIYNPGDLVKVLVIRKVDEKQQLGLSMKPSHFVNDDDESGESSDDDEEEDEQRIPGHDSKNEVAIIADDDSEEEDEEEEDSDESEEGNDEDDTDDGTENEAMVTERTTKSQGDLDTNVGFDWGGTAGSFSQTAVIKDDDESMEDDDESQGTNESSEDEDESGEKTTSNRSSKKTQAARRREEQAVARREAALADGTADENLETSADFERLLVSNPNSSELWIRYMAFHLNLADVAAARQVAEKALDRIEFRQERDKMNVWCALLTLEVKYGNESSVEQALARACQQVNPKHINLRFCEILEKQGSPDAVEKIEQAFTRMCKKFRTKKTVWLAFIKFVLTHPETDQDAFAISKRALLSLPKYKHIWLLSHFAQLLYEQNQAERARAVLEALLRENPKRADLLSLCMDQEVKHGELAELRKLCARVAMPITATGQEDRLVKLNDKQMKKFFKHWFTIEENHGSDADREAVKAAAQRYVQESV